MSKNSKKKWTPTPEQLEKYKKQVEETKELSKTAIRDIFDNYRTDQDKMIEYFLFSSRFYNYSPRNTAMIFQQNPHATFVQSSASWIKMGAYPKKGTHGASILVPQTKKFIIADKDTVIKYQKLTENYRDTILSTNAKYVAVALSEACDEIKEKAKAGEYDIKEKLVFGKGTVFDISQTTYPKEKYPEIFSVGIADEKANFMCKAIANYINEKTPYSIEDVELDSISLGGFFSPSSNAICINTICEDTRKIYDMLHELGHAFYHNLEAQKSEKEDGQNTNILFTTERKEIEADIFATMSLGMYGFELDDQLKSHLKGNYNSYIKQLENAGKSHEDISLDIEKLSTNVMSKFNSHAKEMNQYIEEYTLQQEQETSLEEDEIVEETDEIEMSF